MTRMFTVLIAVMLASLLGAPAYGQTYLFAEVDPLFSFTSTTTHNLPNGFVATTSATGDAFTEMTGAILRYDGGSGTGPSMTIDVPILPTNHWQLTVHYLHLPGCSTRELFLIQQSAPGFQAYVHTGGATLNGVLNGAFASLDNTWYTMEVINDPNINTAEMRIWKDGDLYPSTPTVSTGATGVLADLILRAGNSCAPEKQIEYLSLIDLSPIPVEATTWGGIKAQFGQ